MGVEKESEGNVISRGFKFIEDSWAELKKVHTPTKDETIRATGVVLILMLFFAIFLGFADFLVGKIMQNFLS